MYDHFAGELEKVARVGQEPSLASLLQQRRAKEELEGLREATGKGAYAKGMGMGAALASPLPAAFMMIPWLAAGTERQAAINAEMGKRYIAAELMRRKPETTKQQALGAATDISNFMRQMPKALTDPKVRESVMSMTGRVPESAMQSAKETARKTAIDLTAIDMARRSGLDVTPEFLKGFAKDYQSVPGLASAVQKKTEELTPVMKTFQRLEFAPTQQEWHKLLRDVQARHQGKVGTTPNKIFMQMLGKKMKGVGKATAPFAIAGGIAGALSVRKKRKTLAELQEQARRRR